MLYSGKPYIEQEASGIDTTWIHKLIGISDFAGRLEKHRNMDSGLKEDEHENKKDVPWCIEMLYRKPYRISSSFSGDDEEKERDWRFFRTHLLSATSLASILKCKGSYESFDALFRNKTGQNEHDYIQDQQQDGNEAILALIERHNWEPPSAFYFNHGRKYEEEAKDIYCQLTGREVFKDSPGLMVHPDYPFLGATPDFVCISKDPTIVEVKNRTKQGKIIHGLVSAQHYLQCQVQMMCCPGVKKVHYAEYFRPPNRDVFQADVNPFSMRGRFSIVIIPKNDELCACIPAVVKTFWQGILSYYASVDRTVGTYTLDIPLPERNRLSKAITSLIQTELSKLPEYTKACTIMSEIDKDTATKVYLHTNKHDISKDEAARERLLFRTQGSFFEKRSDNNGTTTTIDDNNCFSSGFKSIEELENLDKKKRQQPYLRIPIRLQTEIRVDTSLVSFD
jgi:hypothetical protein